MNVTITRDTFLQALDDPAQDWDGPILQYLYEKLDAEDGDGTNNQLLIDSDVSRQVVRAAQGLSAAQQQFFSEHLQQRVITYLSQQENTLNLTASSATRAGLYASSAATNSANAIPLPPQPLPALAAADMGGVVPLPAKLEVTGLEKELLDLAKAIGLQKQPPYASTKLPTSYYDTAFDVITQALAIFRSHPSDSKVLGKINELLNYIGEYRTGSYTGHDNVEYDTYGRLPSIRTLLAQISENLAQPEKTQPLVRDLLFALHKYAQNRHWPHHLLYSPADAGATAAARAEVQTVVTDELRTYLQSLQGPKTPVTGAAGTLSENVSQLTQVHAQLEQTTRRPIVGALRRLNYAVEDLNGAIQEIAHTGASVPQALVAKLEVLNKRLAHLSGLLSSADLNGGHDWVALIQKLEGEVWGYLNEFPAILAQASPLAESTGTASAASAVPVGTAIIADLKPVTLEQRLLDLIKAISLQNRPAFATSLSKYNYDTAVEVLTHALALLKEKPHDPNTLQKIETLLGYQGQYYTGYYIGHGGVAYDKHKEIAPIRNLLAEIINNTVSKADDPFSQVEVKRALHDLIEALNQYQKKERWAPSLVSEEALAAAQRTVAPLLKAARAPTLANEGTVLDGVKKVAQAVAPLAKPLAPVVEALKPVAKYGGPPLAVVGTGVAIAHANETAHRSDVGMGEKAASVGTGVLTSTSTLALGAAGFCAIPVVGNGTCITLGTGIAIGTGIGAVGTERIEHSARVSRVSADLYTALTQKDTRRLHTLAMDPHGDIDDDVVVATFEKLRENQATVLNDLPFWVSNQSLVRKMIDALAGRQEVEKMQLEAKMLEKAGSALDRTLNYISDYEGALLLYLGQCSQDPRDLQWALERLNSGLTGEWGDETEYDAFRAGLNLPSVAKLRSRRQ